MRTAYVATPSFVASFTNLQFLTERHALEECSVLKWGEWIAIDLLKYGYISSLTPNAGYLCIDSLMRAV